MGELINLGGRKADTHQQACRHPGMSGTSGIVYWTSIEGGKHWVQSVEGEMGQYSGKGR